MQQVEVRIATLARVFADPSRVKILNLLMRERKGFGTMDICTRLGIPQPRVSSHLSILLKHGLVSVSVTGRQRIYSLASSNVSSAINQLASLSSNEKIIRSASQEAVKDMEEDSEIRQCRSCYDHLAGVAGVNMLDEMLRLHLLSEDQKTPNGKTLYQLTNLGAKKLEERGVDVKNAKASKRMFAYACLDWTERRPHLGGSLGSEILCSLLSFGIVERKVGTRALNLKKPISEWI